MPKNFNVLNFVRFKKTFFLSRIREFEGGSEGGWPGDSLELVCTVHSGFCVPKVLFISHSSQCDKIATIAHALGK